MSCHEEIEVYECTECGCRFESGLADPGPDGQERCPQCLLYSARRVEDVRTEEFVVRRTTRFR